MALVGEHRCYTTEELEEMVAAVTVGAVRVIKLELYEFLGEIQDVASLHMVLFENAGLYYR